MPLASFQTRSAEGHQSEPENVCVEHVHVSRIKKEEDIYLQPNELPSSSTFPLISHFPPQFCAGNAFAADDERAESSRSLGVFF